MLLTTEGAVLALCFLGLMVVALGATALIDCLYRRSQRAAGEPDRETAPMRVRGQANSAMLTTSRR